MTTDIFSKLKFWLPQNLLLQAHIIIYVTGFEKSHLRHMENSCLHEIRHDSIAIYTLSMHQLLNG